MTARLVLVLLLAAAAAGSRAEVRATDDRGREVVLARPAARIVTLSPHLTEIAFAAGAGERVVGVSRFSDYPPAAQALPMVSEAGRVNLEEIARVAPDLALAWVSGNRKADVERVEARGVPVFATEARTLADVARVVRLVGRLAGTEEIAEAAAQALDAQFAALAAAYRGRKAVRVFYEIWDPPLMTVNGAHLVSNLLELCGARNVFAAAGPLTPVVSREQVIAANPDLIVVAAEPARRAERMAAWRKAALAAARADAIYGVDAALTHRMGPRIAAAATALCDTVEQGRAAVQRR